MCWQFKRKIQIRSNSCEFDEGARGYNNQVL